MVEPLSTVVGTICRFLYLFSHFIIIECKNRASVVVFLEVKVKEIKTHLVCGLSNEKRRAQVYTSALLLDAHPKPQL